MAEGPGVTWQVKLLFDEMWLPTLARALRQRGHDVVAVAELPELRGSPDDATYREARRQSRLIVTENVLDYRPPAATDARAGRAHPGLVFTSNRAFPRASRRTAGRLVLALDAFLSTGEAVAGEHWLG